MANSKPLTPEARELRRAYYRAYAKAHPEKAREYQRRYWERKAAEMAKQTKEDK